MKSLSYYIFQIFGWMFGKQNTSNLENNISSTIKSTKNLLKGKKKKFKRIGKLLWNPARFGTYKRHMVKIGRNQSCPCGKMRIAPRDTSKVNKFKFCCGAQYGIYRTI